MMNCCLSVKLKLLLSIWLISHHYQALCRMIDTVDKLLLYDYDDRLGAQ